MELKKEHTIGECVAENIKTAHVFKKYGIDFCCGGGISLEKACEKADVDYEVIREELENVESPGRVYDYNSWNLGFLIDHIKNIHHSYVRDNVEIMHQYAEKVAKVHGENNPNLVEIFFLVNEVVHELISHLTKEEEILFPYVKMLLQAQKENITPSIPRFGSVENPISVMELEHEHAGDTFKKIRELSNNYTPALMACNTYKALYHKLEEFEEDLHQHVHLENNILFPKAKKLEAQLAIGVLREKNYAQ